MRPNLTKPNLCFSRTHHLSSRYALLSSNHSVHHPPQSRRRRRSWTQRCRALPSPLNLSAPRLHPPHPRSQHSKPHANPPSPLTSPPLASTATRSCRSLRMKSRTLPRSEPPQPLPCQTGKTTRVLASPGVHVPSRRVSARGDLSVPRIDEEVERSVAASSPPRCGAG